MMWRRPGHELPFDGHLQGVQHLLCSHNIGQPGKRHSVMLHASVLSREPSQPLATVIFLSTVIFLPIMSYS